MALLDRWLIQPLKAGGSAVLHEIDHVAHPLVHAIEQPIQNIVRDTTEVVTGLSHVVRTTVHMAPYLAGAWLGYSFFGMYFPREKRALESGFYRATKRIRGSPY